MEPSSYSEEPIFPDLSFAMSLLNSTGEAIAVLNEQGTILYCNRAWWSPDFDPDKTPPLQTGQIGQNYIERCNRARNDNPALVESLITTLLRVLSGSTAFCEGEYPYHDRGNERWMRVSVSPMQWEERAFAVIRHSEVTYFVQNQRTHWAEETRIQARQRQIEEMLAYDKLCLAELSSATARLYGKMSLRESNPDVFNSLHQHFSTELLSLADAQESLFPEDGFPERIRSLGDQLGFLRVGPRDVVALHTEALKKAMADATPERTEQLIEMGRFMLLELLGHLVTHYRKYSWITFRPEDAPLSEMRIGDDMYG